ncbi:MgtC/SapB family protein [Singulisphaera sp. Ch08]|uniref:MgtC/SapB family protein n=1 Tax=Singulisphaera sp. Ch08 TaxID=3120278 RepID=A0AAU7CFE0_9BACT
MTTDLGWQEIVIRLTLTVIAGTLVGFNRGEHGRPAGLRTTLLVCMAASISMIQTNLLLATAGRSTDSFVTIDLMRLPLGILTGMGFIGGGAILKRGDIVRGVTTAATLWFMTVIGLCFGGGQKLLGAVALAIGMLVLTGVKRLELRISQDRWATLTLTASLDGPTEEFIRNDLIGRGYRVANWGVNYEMNERRWTVCCHVFWRVRPIDSDRPDFVIELSRLTGVSRLKWSPQGLPDHWE